MLKIMCLNNKAIYLFSNKHMINRVINYTKVDIYIYIPVFDFFLLIFVRRKREKHNRRTQGYEKS